MWGSPDKSDETPARPGSDLLLPREVAQLFRVTTTTVFRWERDGLIRSVRTPSGHRRYPVTEVERFFAQQGSDDIGSEDGS